MKLVLGRDAEVAAWVAARIAQMGPEADFGPCTAIGVVAGDGQPIGGVVFHAYRPRFRTMEISIASASARWLTKNLIAGILAYPFNQLDCQRLTAVIARKNRPSRQFVEAFGFKREGLIRRGFGDDNAVIYGLLKEEWLRSRWARSRKEQNGQELSPAAGGP